MNLTAECLTYLDWQHFEFVDCNLYSLCCLTVLKEFKVFGRFDIVFVKSDHGRPYLITKCVSK